MRVFVTGATGFLGSHLLRALSCPVIALVRDQFVFISAESKDEPIPPATLCMGHVGDLPALERILAEYQIDTVVHLAAQTEISTAATDPIGTWETNVRGTWNVLEAARRQKVKRVIVSASDKSYGRADPPYREDSPLLPDRPYESSKACADLIARTYASTYGMSVAVTRCVNLYGPGCLTLSTLIPNTIRRILRGEPPIVRNGGRMRRDWLYIGDAVDGYLALMRSDYVGPMNFGSGVGISVRQVVDMILRIMGSDLAPIDEPDRHGEIVHQWADASLAKRVLGWEPKVPLREGLERTVEWYRDHFMGAQHG